MAAEGVFPAWPVSLSLCSISRKAKGSRMYSVCKRGSDRNEGLRGVMEDVLTALV